jgi:isopenicillin-N N-acyltransferase-like protein
MRELVLDGAPAERGRVHGEELRADIADAMGRWRDALGRDVGDPGAYLVRFLDDTDHLPAITRHAPNLVEEMRGLAEGAAIPLADCLAYQLMDEEWRYRQTALVASRCSGVGEFGEIPGQALLAQNMDLPSHYDGSQVLLRVRAGEKEAMVFSAAGMLGLDGLNSDGVGVCCNTLAQLRTSASGLPVTFTVREVLARPTLSEAAGFVHTVPHAVGQNYLVGSPGRVVSLECSAGGVREYAPHPTRVLHTNHPLANDDFAAEPGGEIGALSETERRFEFLEQRVFADAPLTVDDVKTLLSDRTTPVCKIPTADKPSITLGCLVMELSAEPVLHLAPGPPSETPFEQFRFGPPV